MALFTRFVQPGRLVAVNYGPEDGKMATVIDIVDHRRIVIDGPVSVTGCNRHQIPVKWVSLTDVVTPLPRGAREKVLKNALKKNETMKKWSETTWAKKIAAKRERNNLNDFGRFKLMLGRKKKSGQTKAEIKKTKGGAKKGKKGASKAEAVAAEPQDTESLLMGALTGAGLEQDADTLEMAVASMVEGLPALQKANASGGAGLETGLEELFAEIDLDVGDKLGAVATGLKCYALGLANPVAEFVTSSGTFSAEIYLDRMPLTASNFLDLVDAKFYDGLHFHRIVPNFMIQFGCPISRDPAAAAGEGAPAPGSKFKVVGSGEEITITRGSEGDEAGCIPDEHTEKISNMLGTLAMANNDKPSTGGSQFFVNTQDNPILDFWNEESESKHPVFGCVFEDDMKAVLKIGKCKCDSDEKPIKPVVVKSVRVR